MTKVTAKKARKTSPVRRKRLKPDAPSIPALTYGEKLVGITFNPSGDPDVLEIKRLYARIIDHCSYEVKRIEGTQPVREAFLKQAIWMAIDAQMWAVKGWTFQG